MYKKPQKMADGGFVDEPDKLLGDLTPGDSEQMRPTPGTLEKPGPTVTQTTAQPAAIVTAPSPKSHDVSRGTSLPGFPVNDPAINDYFESLKGKVGQYGGQDQMALQQAIANQPKSMGYRATDALKGFSDALMQGVARAGNPGNEKQFEDLMQQRGQQQLETMKGAHQANIQDLNESMKIDADNPTSMISKSAQASYGPLLVSMGIPKQAVQGMSASLIADVAEKKVTAEEAMSRIQETATYHKGELANQAVGLGVREQEVGEKQKEIEAQHPFQKMFGMLDNTPETPSASQAQFEVPKAPGMASFHPSGAKVTRLK